MAVPVPENASGNSSDADGGLLYISSGTWSLMGTELTEADCSAESRTANLTNEGGYEYRFRYLKNIMGLWMIQSVKKELAAAGETYSFAELCRMASEETIQSIVPCNDDVFLAPESMTEAIKEYLRKSGQEVPETAGAADSFKEEPEQAADTEDKEDSDEVEEIYEGTGDALKKFAAEESTTIVEDTVDEP